MNKIFSGIVFGFWVSLGVSGTAFADSLSVSPAHPTIMDPVRLTIIIPNWDCCTQYLYDSTLVTMMGDTAVMLSYQHRMPRICPMIACLDVPRYLTFKRGPLPAGKYSVWETQQLVCDTPLLCVTLPVVQNIGKFTVEIPTALSFGQRPAPLKNIGKTFGNECVYDIRGALVSPNRAGLSKRIPGIYFTKTGGSLTKRIMP